MIWVDGRIVPDESLTISALDRAFEHGLGLFETFRTWNDHPTLLDRHLARMARSAEEIGIPFDSAKAPTAAAVAELIRASGFESDAMVRMTLSGGLSDTSGSILWMRASPLPPEIPKRGARVAFGLWTINSHGDPLFRHKTLNYWSRRLIYEWATRSGFDEVLSKTERDSLRTVNVWEGSRTNLFLVRNGVLITPPLDGPVLPGVMRALVLEHAARLSLPAVDDRLVTEDELFQADEVFLTNSVRGIIPVEKVERTEYDAPGSLTRCLMVHLSDWLRRGGTEG